MQLLQLRKESLKKIQAYAGFEPAPSWLVSSIGRALHRYRRSQGFESRTSLNFFRLSFHSCKSCVYNCDDLLSNNSSFTTSNRRLFDEKFLSRNHGRNSCVELQQRTAIYLQLYTEVNKIRQMYCTVVSNVKKTYILDKTPALIWELMTSTLVTVDSYRPHLFFFPLSINPKTSLTSVTICFVNLSTYTPNSRCSRTARKVNKKHNNYAYCH